MLGPLVWESPNLWPLAALVAAVSILAIVWFYPGQLRGNGLARWLPFLLRCLAVAALALSLLKPVFLQPKRATQWGAVVVLMDCSKSMGVIDSARSPAQQTALASALGRLPAGARSVEAVSLASALDELAGLNREVSNAQSDWEYARVAGHGVQEKQARLAMSVARYAQSARAVAARSASIPQETALRQRLKDLETIPATDSHEGWTDEVKNRIEKAQAATHDFQAAADDRLYKSNADIRRICDQISKLSRLDLAKELLLRPQAGLIDKLGPDVPVIGLAIGRGIEPLALTSSGKPVGTLAILPDAHDSDLTGAVTGALNEFSGRPVRALVLLSDGRQVGGRRDLTSAIHPSGVPIFTVGLAPDSVPDVSISDVSLSTSSAFAGEMIEGDARVTVDGAVRPPAQLLIRSSSGEQTEALTSRGTRNHEHETEWTAHFSVAVDQKDRQAAQRFVLQVPAVPGESTPANNRVERWIKVSSARLRVAVCTAAPSWDFQYLRGALARSPWVQLESEVLDPEHPRLALSPAQILDEDVLILSDIPVDGLDVNQWDAIQKLVTSRGGSVMLIAGTSYPIGDYARQPIARSLLPFHDVQPIWKEWPGLQPAFHFAPTPLGEQEMLRLGEGGDADARHWQDLPGLFRYLQIPRANLYPDVQPLLLESEGGGAVLTERRIGAGRVLFLGLNETWRWRLKNGERDADQFWRQLVRHAAGEPYAAAEGPLALDVDKVALRPGETVRVRARVRGAKVPAESARSCPLRILRNSKVVATAALQATGGGHFAGSIGDLPEGDYQLEMRGTAGDGAQVAVSVPLHVAVSDEAEMRDVSGDRAMLTRISRSSGGQFLPIEQADRLPAALLALRETESRFIPRPLWNSPFFFVFVLACFAAEWALRKRLGLA